jgi:hypothetical protein
VTQGNHGAGVSELIGRLLEDDLQSLGPRKPRNKLVPYLVSETPE